VSNKALGKGLEALMQTGLDDSLDFRDNGDNRLIENFIDISMIITNPDQPRKEFKEEALQELADSIKEIGIIQPIIVEKKNGKYEIVAGERRYRASKIAGLKKIPVIEKSFSEEEKYEIALIENIQREDLSPIEEAKAYLQLINNYTLSQEALSKKLGKKRSTIANSLRLLKMPQDMQSALNTGEISAGHARSILSVVNPADQRILFNRILTGGLSVRESEKQSSELNKGIRLTSDSSKKDDNLLKKKNPDVMSVEQRFIDALGTKVNLKGNLAKGKIEITYFSKEDLERIFEIIVT
jgi:ParB family transcriptional regulator, chromosome partitioning protein